MHKGDKEEDGEGGVHDGFVLWGWRRDEGGLDGGGWGMSRGGGGGIYIRRFWGWVGVVICRERFTGVFTLFF